MAEPTRERLAKDYAKALTTIDAMRCRAEAAEADWQAAERFNAELLDALRAFCGDYESKQDTRDSSLNAAYQHAMTIIAKAEGR